MKIDWTKGKNKPAIVIVDLGNNYLKCYVFYFEKGEAKNKIFSMPHGFIPLTDVEWEQAVQEVSLSRGRNSMTHTFNMVIGGTTKEPELRAVRIGSGPYKSHKNRPLFGSNKYMRGGIDALLLACLLEVFPEGHDNIVIGFGFPPTEWQQVDTIGKLLVGKKPFINTEGKKKMFHIRGAIPWDENVGGLINSMSVYNSGRTPDGKFTSVKFQPGDRLLIIDLGGWLGSIAYAEINDDGFPIIEYDNEIASIDGGAITIRNSLRQALKQAFRKELLGVRDTDLRDSDLDDVIRNGIIKIRGDEFDANEAVVNALDVLELIRVPYTNLFASGRFVQHIILTGGTVDMIHDYLLELLDHQNIHMAGKPGELYFANVRGGMHITLDRLIAENNLPEEFENMIGDE